MSQQPLILLCPGQGAQQVGMGRTWAEHSPAAREVFDRADAVLGMKLSDLCFDGPEVDLNRTDIAQAAIYVTTLASIAGLIERGDIDLADLQAAAGLSLGEYTALHLAGVFSMEDGLRLVRLRGQFMQEAAEANPSSMVALTGEVSESKIDQLCDAARGGGVLVPANFNSPMQIVVSGSTDACERAVEVAGEMGLRATPLTVAGAFHSPFMQSAADRMAEALAQVDFQPPRCTVMSNVTGQPHGDEPATIRDLLVRQITSPVRWTQNMQYLAEHMAGRYVEPAPGKVLTGLARRIDRSMKVDNRAEAA